MKNSQYVPMLLYSNSGFWGNPSASVSKLCCCPAYARWLPWKPAAESQCSPSPWRQATSSPRRPRLQRPKRLFKENLSCFCSARIPMDVTLRSGTVGPVRLSPLLFCVSSSTTNDSQTKLTPVCADLQKAGFETYTHWKCSVIFQKHLRSCSQLEFPEVEGVTTEYRYMCKSRRTDSMSFCWNSEKGSEMCKRQKQTAHVTE